MKFSVFPNSFVPITSHSTSLGGLDRMARGFRGGATRSARKRLQFRYWMIFSNRSLILVGH
jgi:hypothetical protein